MFGGVYSGEGDLYTEDVLTGFWGISAQSNDDKNDINMV